MYIGFGLNENLYWKENPKNDLGLCKVQRCRIRVWITDVLNFSIVCWIWWFLRFRYVWFLFKPDYLYIFTVTIAWESRRSVKPEVVQNHNAENVLILWFPPECSICYIQLFVSIWWEVIYFFELAPHWYIWEWSFHRPKCLSLKDLVIPILLRLALTLFLLHCLWFVFFFGYDELCIKAASVLYELFEVLVTDMVSLNLSRLSKWFLLCHL